jgi:2-polyprenyl-6-methoxyphenol hydroxylase-like FAD-dependent oxidoreductase
MSDPSATDLVSACSSLANRALSGAQEIVSILIDRVDDAGTPEFQKLRSLAAKLQQLSKDAAELQAGVPAASVISAELQTALSTQLSQCDAAAAIVTRQLMSLGRNTPKESVNVPTILLYESFAESTTRFLFFTTQLLSM